jgi:hypothetical protein
MILALQEIIYQKLNIAEIKNKVSGIYYYVPSNTKFPYIYVGDFYSKNKSIKSSRIEEVNFRIIIYVRDKSLKSMLELGFFVKRRLNSSDGVIIYYLDEKVSLQNDGITHQIAMNFKAIMEENYAI